MARLQVTGSPTRVIDDLPQASVGTPLADVSATGTLVYAPPTATSRLVQAGDLWIQDLARATFTRLLISSPHLAMVGPSAQSWEVL